MMALRLKAEEFEFDISQQEEALKAAVAERMAAEEALEKAKEVAEKFKSEFSGSEPIDVAVSERDKVSVRGGGGIVILSIFEFWFF
jgi:predicted  nucleic acid-binding Zn-ribbon protein